MSKIRLIYIYTIYRNIDTYLGIYIMYAYDYHKYSSVHKIGTTTLIFCYFCGGTIIQFLNGKLII